MSFIQFDDGPQVSPPYAFPSTTLHMFMLGADGPTLQAWCDSALNIDAAYRFEVLFPFVLLTISDYPKMILEGFEGFGYSEQGEYALMFPVVRFDDVGGFLVPADITWATPYIGVDLVTSAMAGQMVLGFPKLSGIVTRVVNAADGSFTSTVKMPGTPTPVTKVSKLDPLLTIVEVETGISAPSITGFLTPSKLLANKLHDDLGVQNLMESLDPDIFSLTNLKQFRDPADREQAVYQALVRAEWQQTNISDVQIYDGARVTITDNAMVHIAETLGLSGGGGSGGNVFAAQIASSTRCDLHLDNATTVVRTI